MLRQQAAGADLAHLKPPHVNLSDGILDSLINEPLAAPVTQEEDHEETIKSYQKNRKRRQRQPETTKTNKS